MFRGTQQKGRTTPNKSNTRIKEAFAELIENNLDKLQIDLDNLDSRDRLKFLIDLAAYVVPKLRSVDIKETPFQNQFNPLDISEFLNNNSKNV